MWLQVGLCLPKVEIVGKFRMVTCNCGITSLWRIQRYVWHIAPRDVTSVGLALSVGFVLDRGLISPFLLPPQAENLKRGGMFMMDGKLFFFFFFKGSITGCRMGGIQIETSGMWWDRQEHTSLMSRCQAEGVLTGQTVPSLSWGKEGATGDQRGAGTAVQTRSSGLGFPVSWAPF